MPCKYSIILPCWNGGDYLKACVDSIVSQSYHDYELIISDDHSADDSRDYLQALLIACPFNVKVIYPPEELSMTEHWEWALSHAVGEWQIFVGQDDGLQPYFFSLADKLTAEASRAGINAIMSQRAYYFWPGCEPVYGDAAVSYVAEPKVKILDSRYQALKALLGWQDYFELPEMYTTSLFHRSLLARARELQDGKVLTCHPQDANLGAIACSLEKKYLKSFVPLGWVGSSIKSAGMAVTDFDNVCDKDREGVKKLRTVYLDKTKKSRLPYSELAGDFSFGDLSLYFWQAFLQTPLLRPLWVNELLKSRVFKTFVFAGVFLRISKSIDFVRWKALGKIIDLNSCSRALVVFMALFFLGVRCVIKAAGLFWRLLDKVSDFFVKKKIFIEVKRSMFPLTTLKDASDMVLVKVLLFRVFDKI